VNLDPLLLLVLHLACLAMLAATCLLGVRRRRLYSVFFAAAALYQAVSLFGVAGLTRDYGATVVLRAEIIAISGALLVAAVVLLGERWVPLRRNVDAGPGPFETVVQRPVAYFTTVALSLVLAVGIMARDGSAFMERTWQQARLESGYLDSLAILILFIVFPAVWVATRARRPWLGVALLLVCLMLFVVYGSRAAMLTLPMAVVLDLLARVGRFRIRARTIVLIGAGALGLHVIGRLVRGFGLAGFFALLRGQSLSAAEVFDVLGNIDLSGGEAAIFGYFLFAVAEAPFADIAPLTSVIRWLGIYIPGALFPAAKPVDLTYTLWWHAYSAGVFDIHDSFGELLKVVGAGGGGSLHSLVWGEMWLNGGLPAVPIFAACLGCILLIIEVVYDRVPATVYLLSAPATLIGYVMVARGNSVIGLGYTAYVLPLAMLAYGLTRLGQAIWHGLSNDDRRSRARNESP
jgi:hypothetical protein